MIKHYLIEALNRIETILEQESENFLDWQSACYQLSTILQGMGLFDLSRCWRSIALQEQLNKSDVYCSLGELYVFLDIFETAIIAYKKSIKIGDNLLAYNNLATLYNQQGEKDKALYFWYQAFCLNSQQINAKSCYKLGKGLSKVGKLSEAIECYQQAIISDSEFLPAYKELIKLLMQLQEWQRVIAIAETLIILEQKHPWLYSDLGNCYRELGQLDQAKHCFLAVSQLRGWSDCVDKNYEFTHDNFTYKIPLWQVHLKSLSQPPEINALEIGVSQGMSTCWLLDNLLTRPSDKLICINKEFTEIFLSNLAKTKATQKVKMLEGKIKKNLMTLEKDAYHFIHFNQGYQSMEQNLGLCWTLLKVEGVFIFNDSNRKKNNLDAQQSQGIDAFLKTLANQVKILHRSHQVIFKKLKN